MREILSTSRINYVWMHFDDLYDISALKPFIHYVDTVDNIALESSVSFWCSAHDLNMPIVEHIDTIPVLFPQNSSLPFYSIQNSRLIFHHDLMKSAFYLLSGIQEYKRTTKDAYLRFRYVDSIQAKHNFTIKPIVNYYFEIIYNGLTEFASLNNLPLPKKKKRFASLCFNLTHDVDRLDKYTFYNLLGRLKQTIGLIPSNSGFFDRATNFYHFFINYLKSKQDPHWSFDFLLEIEKKHNIKASYFFLDKMHKRDASYKFNEPRIINLFNTLYSLGHEIAMHGSYKSYNDSFVFNTNKTNLEKQLKQTIKGNRQHFLRYTFPETPDIHAQIGLKYDSSLGFAEHEGFRNSYCFPFKLYDFTNEKPYSFWEIPLTVMDSTLFDYRKLTYQQAKASIMNLVNEAAKFNGVFTLLWHNNYLDDLELRGIRNFYKEIVSEISNFNSKNLSSIALIDFMSN